MSNDADESEPDGGTNGGANAHQSEAEPDDDTADPTVPQVDLTLRELSVSVTGRSDDDLETVEQSALALMEHLVDKAETLEEDHDEYGLT